MMVEQENSKGNNGISGKPRNELEYPVAPIINIIMILKQCDYFVLAL